MTTAIGPNNLIGDDSGMAGTESADAGLAFKGRMMTLTIVEIRETDCDRIAALIDEQLARAPGFFTRLPVLLSLPEQVPDLEQVRDIMSRAGLVVAGVVDPGSAAEKAASRAGLGVIHTPGRAATRSEAQDLSRQKSSAPAAEQDGLEKSSQTPTRLITRPIRSGQQVYARGGDLVVATAVSEGAEVVADGHIHVYGALRGRALAGASGDENARIYCRRFEPELIAIAGRYKVADAMDENMRSRQVQVCLEHDHLLIELQE